MTYYWLNAIDTEPGCVINPGTWSRIISQTPGHGWALLEEVYERIRYEQFADYPSRKKSVFVFNRENDALEFRNSRPQDILYEVEIVEHQNETTKIGTFDMSVINPDIPHARPLSVKELEKQAVTYWQTGRDQMERQLAEIVIEGQIKILRRLS